MQPWIKIGDLKPPYDTLVLVRGNNKYAIAFNQCYRPNIYMTQVIEHKNNTEYCDFLPFEIEEWMEIPK